MALQIYLFIKRKKDDLWSYESHRSMTNVKNSIEQWKKNYPGTKFKWIVLN